MIFNTCKRGLFSFQLKTRQGYKFKLPKKSNVSLKVYPEGDNLIYPGVKILILANKKAISKRIFHSIYFHNKYPNIFIAQTEEDINKMVAVESTTGVHTDDLRIVGDNYVVDFNNNVYMLNEDCTLEKKDLKFIKTDNEYYIICKDKTDNMIVFSYNDLSPVESDGQKLYENNFKVEEQGKEKPVEIEDEEERE